MFVDNYILNGQGFGEVAKGLQEVHYDHHLLRPFIEDNPNSPNRGRPCCNMMTGKILVDDKGRKHAEVKKFTIRALQERGINSPVFNSTLLPKDAWIRFDAAVTRTQRQNRDAWNDLARHKRVSGFDAMATLTFEYRTLSDAGEALQDMDMQSPDRTDRPLENIRSIPLAITHSGFFFTERELAVARNKGMPLDDEMAEQAANKNNELIERQTIGTEAGTEFGTRTTGDNPHTGLSKVYGFTTFPYRITKTDLTTPTGTNPEAVMTDVLEMIELMRAQGFNGPFVLYHSTGYSRYLQDDYYRSGSTSAVRSLRERLMAIEGDITDIRRLNFLTSGYQLILVGYNEQASPRAIDGMSPRLVQWDTQGGGRKNFRVIQIQAPQFRSTPDGTCPVVHATTS